MRRKPFVARVEMKPVADIVKTPRICCWEGCNKTYPGPDTPPGWSFLLAFYSKRVQLDLGEISPGDWYRDGVLCPEHLRAFGAQLKDNGTLYPMPQCRRAATPDPSCERESPGPQCPGSNQPPLTITKPNRTLTMARTPSKSEIENELANREENEKQQAVAKCMDTLDDIRRFEEWLTALEDKVRQPHWSAKDPMVDRLARVGMSPESIKEFQAGLDALTAILSGGPIPEDLRNEVEAEKKTRDDALAALSSVLARRPR